MAENEKAEEELTEGEEVFINAVLKEFGISDE